MAPTPFACGRLMTMRKHCKAESKGPDFCRPGIHCIQSQRRVHWGSHYSDQIVSCTYYELSAFAKSYFRQWPTSPGAWACLAPEWYYTELVKGTFLLWGLANPMSLGRMLVLRRPLFPKIYGIYLSTKISLANLASTTLQRKMVNLLIEPVRG